MIKQYKLRFYNFKLVILLTAISLFGVQLVASASPDLRNKQLLGVVMGLVLLVILSLMDYSWILNFQWIMYGFNLLMLIGVRLFGSEAGGASRWLDIGGFRFQPSEIAKIAIITFLPVLIIKTGRKVRKPGTVAFLVLVGLIQAAGAFVLTDNLSTGIIIGGIAMVMIFIAHPKTKPFLVVAAIIGTIAGSIVAYMGLTMTTSEDFRIRRILAWLHPEANMSSGGYQALQGLYAIGSGGFFGKGLGNSAQKLGTIPEAQNDMIFSIVCEELGVFGAALLLLMFGYLLYRLFFIAQNAPDLYGTLVVAGIFVHIALQVILNLCVVLNLMPTTGITLPFVSYGGTSILFLMTEMGIALSVSGQIRTTEAEREEMMEVETEQ